LFAALTFGWTWPLAAHLSDAIPGHPGDNFSFVWNLWWMRHVLATPGAEFFRTTHLFYPFGTTLADHPHTALPGFIAATLLRPLSAAAAQNVLLLAFVFANMTTMYALAWDLTRHHRAAVLAGVLFGTSPYLAVHLLGHFDLVAAWVLPAFALLLRRAVGRDSNAAAIGAGLVLAATAFTAYYYVVYLCVFAVTYLVARLEWIAMAWSARELTPTMRRLRTALPYACALLAGLAVWVVTTGGVAIERGPLAVSIRAPQNTLTLMWVVAIVWAALSWRPTLTVRRPPSFAVRRTFVVASVVAAVFVAGSWPLIREASRLVARGEYVTPAYNWRSVPRGVDLLAPLLGHPLQPLMQPISRRAYALARLDYVEAIGWIGIVPAWLLLGLRSSGTCARSEGRLWWTVAAVFGLLALGPLLTVGGFDTGLRLPGILLRFVPFVANARMPGRAMVGVFLALAMLVAIKASTAGGVWRTPAVQWLLVALLALEYYDAPIPLTLLDQPRVYQELAIAAPGAVCEVPFGIGDGLSEGVGSQDRRMLYYATLHEHPLVGGFIGRMPPGTTARYEAMPVVGPLLRLSDGRPAQLPPPSELPQTPCRYFMVSRSSSAALLAFVHELPVESISDDDQRELYRLRAR
jgi:hypothetical protein